MTVRQRRSVNTRYVVTLLDEHYEVRTLSDLLVMILSQLDVLDDTPLPRLSNERSRTRRYVARRPDCLYPGRPDLTRYHRQIKSGWFVGTNYSQKDVEQIIHAICKVSGLKYGKDIRFRKGGDEL